MAYKRLGDVLIDAGLITEDQLGHALKQQKETKRRLGDELIAEGVLTGWLVFHEFDIADA